MQMTDTQELGIAAPSELTLNLTIVMVHGAWADGSSWSSVIRPLQAKGFKVVAAPIPLTSLSECSCEVFGVYRWAYSGRGRDGGGSLLS